LAKPNTIEDVRSFWDNSPLFTGESKYAAGTKDFIDQLRQIYYDDIFAGALDDRLFPPDLAHKRILDVGCGVGFWLIEFARHGATDISGVDLSARSVELARLHCQAHDVPAKIQTANAEALDFAAETFDHVNCHGVVHHTVHPEAAVREIHRVLKIGGTATIAVYYRNLLLRQWQALHPVLRFIPIGLKGRSRERMSELGDADEIVRQYDGAENPIGLAYNREEFRQLLGPFEVSQFYYHYFPRRALPIGVPDSVHRVLDRALPFMIYANVVKTRAD
jgi:2-polyprenyl-3-methyl-5-hydroxy-6-metoxy-1,4-benzoquinol methylase